MKRAKILILVCAIVLTATAAVAREIVTVVFKVEQMECNGCAGKVKNNIKFVKGVKNLKTDVETRTVTISFDQDKTSVEKIQAAFAKMKYEAVAIDTLAVKK